MHQVDPMADSYSSATPYNFSFNDPVTFTDPNGAEPPGIHYLYDTYVAPYFHPRIMDTGVFGSPGGGGNGYGGGMTVNINLDEIENGAHIFNFTNGQLSNYNFISDAEFLRMGLGMFQQMLGLAPWASNYTGEVLEQSNFGNFRQTLADGSHVIPYTSLAYSSSITSMTTGTDNSWRTPWFFLDGFLHPELMNASTPSMSGSVATGYAGAVLATTEGALYVDSKIAQGTYYTSAATERAKLLAGKDLVGKAGRFVGGAGAVATLAEGMYDGNGFTVGDGVRFGLSAATAFGGAYGAIYGVLDLGIGIWSGTSVTDRIGAGIDYSMGAPKLPK
jgi:hypothetical protein